MTTLPRRPTWWTDPEAAAKRLAVIAEFESSDLVAAMGDLEMHMTSTSESPEDVAAVVRRELSVRWLAELGRAKILELPVSDSALQWVLHWQQVAADYLAELAWRQLIGIPAEITQRGVALAMATNVEHEAADANDR